jgi:hypothetical protein
MKTAIIGDFLKFYGEKRGLKIYKSSTAKFRNSIFLLIRENLERKLVIFHSASKAIDDMINRFQASETGEFLIDGKTRIGYKICPCNHHNSGLMREIFTFTRPKIVGLAPTIGTGIGS